MIDPPIAPPRPAELLELADLDFEHAPFIVIWETTQACDLACLHCRASARPARDAGELTTAEAMRLMNDVREFGRVLFVLTGGDPLKRPDTLPLVEHGARIGLRMALTPSGTPLMTPRLLAGLRDAGLARLAVSLDGSAAAIHDRFRGVPGSYEWTLRMLRAARDIALPTQVNTTVTRYNVDDLEPMIGLVQELGIVLWSVFLVVPTGRARSDDLPAPHTVERVLHRLYDLSGRVPFRIKTTAAPHYRRVIVQRSRDERSAPGSVSGRGASASSSPGGPGFARVGGARRNRGVNDGNGFVFISHRGDIYPSGFLPLRAGNVRTHDLGEVYREHDVFRALRTPRLLKGKCGVCEFRTICGGSRARAYAMTGDYLESDPACAYVPPAYARRVSLGRAEDVDSYFARRLVHRERPA